MSNQAIRFNQNHKHNKGQDVLEITDKMLAQYVSTFTSEEFMEEIKAIDAGRDDYE